MVPLQAVVMQMEQPEMVVQAAEGEYEIRGKTVRISRDAVLPIDPPEKIRVFIEEHVLSDEKPQFFSGGTMLKKTISPADYIRLNYAIVPESVKVYYGDSVYKEGVDYFLDHEYGGISRIEGGSISPSQTVFVDYDVYLQRIDAVQVDEKGKASIKKGVPGQVNIVPPEADPGCTAVANVWVPYRTASITAENIFPLPAKDLTWQDFIEVSGREHLRNTLKLLKEGKPITIVCWGDSVTSGASPSSHDKCYVELFRSLLKEAYPNAQINLINAGIGGTTTDTRRDGFEKEVLSYNPDLITVEFVNDMSYNAEKIAANYAEFISKARAKNPNVEFIVQTPAYIMPAWMKNGDTFYPAVRKAAADNNVALSDTANIWENLKTVGIPYMTLNANGINHPNDLGHEFFAYSMMELLKP